MYQNLRKSAEYSYWPQAHLLSCLCAKFVLKSIREKTYS